MNKRKICIIMHNDLMDYPPMISLIDIMKELGEDIIYIGGVSDYQIPYIPVQNVPASYSLPG